MTNQEIPKQIGRYEVQEKLGEGAMAVVYKAFDAEIGRSLAIKVLRPEVLADAENRSRFLSEAKAAGNLNHPNIVTIFDVGECELGPFIVMEFLDGETLEEVMIKKDEFEYREILEMGIQLAEALDYSHANGVVHRDIKPSNIMRPRDEGLLRITDFGIAHLESPDKMHKTLSGTILGTPQYMSPEQVEGEPVDGRSDLFSVGVILYQLITGQRPFAANSLASLYIQITREEPRSLERLAPSAPKGLVNAVAKLLNKEPARRFQSGKELAAALRGVIDDISAREKRQAEARLMPLRVKLTMALGLLVTVAMASSAYFIHRKEMDAMTGLALDFGSSLAEFIASQSAESMVVKDWIAVEFFVDETKHRQQISHLQVVDRDGIVRGSSQTQELGKPYAKLAHAQLIERSGDTIIHEVKTQTANLFDFEVPITYQDKEMGRVHLGLTSAALDQAANVTLYTMLGLILGVVLIVVIAAYLLASRISAPMQILSDALKKAGRGNLSHRITEKRNDELGRMFDEFNRMADALENLQDENQVLTQTLTGRTVSGIRVTTISGSASTAGTGGTLNQTADEDLASTRVSTPSE